MRKTLSNRDRSMWNGTRWVSSSGACCATPHLWLRIHDLVVVWRLWDA